MATLNPISVVPSPVPNGTVGLISLTFALNPGTPDETANLQVYSGGVLQQAASGILLKGVPAETAPVVAIGSTNVGWEIRSSAGTLAALGNNQFTLHY